ncbi:hypothetical protein F3Y22_tig00000764pilonHSYRG00117 [Hibiscus syriacus]|uniref:EF-hand domain-containing protein n=1 Tax=Hibiscus syriacus TaxID=106335 RepID=A0A6A3D596_HIBSY|nr:hypothetical protein F3Y22_tig00000764pilonHSYRG00117 [Hibiscus syriacus]
MRKMLLPVKERGMLDRRGKNRFVLFHSSVCGSQGLHYLLPPQFVFTWFPFICGSQFTSRTQMTEDEMVVHFFQFDEAGKGSISTRDLRRVAIAHDFIWTDEELTDMIHCFDTDGDGKLNLDDFRKIVSRCNMLRTSENP